MGLTLKMRKRLPCAARSAIKARSQEPDIKKAIKLTPPTTSIKWTYALLWIPS